MRKQILFNKKIILFHPLLKLNQLKKELADPKIADFMPRAKNAESTGRRDLLTGQSLSFSFNHFFKIQNYIVHVSD